MDYQDFVIDPEVLRLAMRQWATGVTIVTSQANGVRHGMTVSSFTSVSLSPPLILVSLEGVTRTHQMVKESGIFAVTVLNSQQKYISNRFAGWDTENTDRFVGIDTFTMVSGTPLISGGLAGFDCKVVSEFIAGNHTVFIGEVMAAHIGEENRPLIYYNRNYHELSD